MSILHDICNNKYVPAELLINTPSSLRLKEETFFDAVEKAMGADFIERHEQGLCECEHFENYASFREGFRLGVSLMMELL